MRNRGFASIFALVLVALVAAALSAMAITIHMEQLRLRSAQSQAALRQLLLAGASEVAERSHAWPATPTVENWSIQLPAAVSANGGQLTASLLFAGPADVSVQVTAAVDGHAAHQVILFHRSENAWIAQSARLVP